MSSSISIKKYNINELCSSFKEKVLLNPARFDLIKKSVRDGLITYNYLRPITWKIFLGTLPNSANISNWVETVTSQREEYKKKTKKYCKMKKFIGDPLGGGNKKKDNWDNLYEENELKNLINLDLARTYQDIDLFLQSKIKNVLANVLFIWSKENSDVSYRQGMNEILAVLFLAFYPYYHVSNCKPKPTSQDIKGYLKDTEFNIEEIYKFFHDEEEIQSDLFFVFDSVMKKGLKNLFDQRQLTNEDPNYKLYELFPDVWKDTSDEDAPTYINRRSSLLVKEKLKCLDNDLYSHFKKIDLNCNVFLQRWMRCMFCREFEINDVFILWDSILCHEYLNLNNQKYNLMFLDDIAIAMILRIRDNLKDSDQNDCFTNLFKYPKVNDILELIKLSIKVDNAINERLQGKNSNVYDILGIMKPIESQPTQIFSPHMYSQINNKKDQLISNRTNNNNQVKKEEEYESVENINQQSNNNENIGSQAKKFFGSALSSIGAFGGMLADQLATAKDSVMEKIDSLTNVQNDSGANYKSNEVYEDEGNEYNNYGNYQKYENNNYSSNYVSKYGQPISNVSNGLNNREEDVKENYNNSNSSNDLNNNSEPSNLNYNKDDMKDIINKLKEIDVKYNMFFSDKDKKDYNSYLKILEENHKRIMSQYDECVKENNMLKAQHKSEIIHMNGETEKKIVSLIPVFNTMRKTPAQILSRHDLE